MQRRVVGRTDLPLDLAGLVLRLLPAYADRACFAAVCPQWRGAARQLPLSPPLPLLAFPDDTFFSLPYGKPFRFPGFGCADYKCSSACGSWVVFSRDNGCFLVDPFAGATLMLPPVSRIRLNPPNAVAKHVEADEHFEGIIRFGFTWMDMKFSEESALINKLVVCSPNLVAAFFSSKKSGGGRSQIAVCQPGASSWSVRTYDQCQDFEDMAFYEGRLYALTGYLENVLIFNISQDPAIGNPQVSHFGRAIRGFDTFFPAWFPDDSIGSKKLYLVESCGTLLMVRRKVCCRIIDHTVMAGRRSEFEVFKADIQPAPYISRCKVCTCFGPPNF